MTRYLEADVWNVERALEELAEPVTEEQTDSYGAEDAVDIPIQSDGPPSLADLSVCGLLPLSRTGLETHTRHWPDAGRGGRHRASHAGRNGHEVGYSSVLS